MVFEALYKTKDIEAKPWDMLIYSFISSSISLLIANMMFPSDVSIVFIFLTTLALSPVVQRILQDQEQIDEMEFREMRFFERYGKIIEIYSYFFLGIVISVALWSSYMSKDTMNHMFKEQITTLNAIRGYSNYPGGDMVHMSDFFNILYNNLEVAAVAFLLSFFFGTGAIFILSWNASVIGVFTTIMAKDLASQGHSFFLSHITALLSISLHGIPEVLGYFLAGIAGGILSMGLINGENRKIIFLDAFELFLLSLAFIVSAAFIEAFITPIL